MMSVAMRCSLLALWVGSFSLHLSSCATTSKHIEVDVPCECLTVQDLHELDQTIDNALFEYDHKDVDGLTRTMNRLQREKFKRNLKRGQ